MERYTRATVRRALDHLVRAAKAAGYPLPDSLALDIGSRTNGIAYRLFWSGGRGEYHEIRVLGLSNGYLGMTAREATETLRTMAGVLWGISDVKKEAEWAARNAS